MNDRLPVLKTYKLFINGQFPRSESGRTMPASALEGAPDGAPVEHVSKASRKDLRDAVVAARAAGEGWMSRSAYNRGQVLYRLAEMIESRADEFARAIAASAGSGGALKSAQREVASAVDRLVAWAGWTDKFSQVLGSHNPVNGPYYTFTVPEATGLCAVIAPDERPLLALVSLFAPALAAGNTVVAVASAVHPVPACLLGEACAVSDLPPGVLNILTGDRAELLPWIAQHRDIDCAHAALEGKQATLLRAGAAENIKRVIVHEGVSADDWYDSGRFESPWMIEPLVEMKTIWHPSAT